LRRCSNNATKPIEILSCGQGQGTAPFCGDGVCDITENEDSCPEDCGTIEIARAGDGRCSPGESSYTNPDECEPVKTKSRAWIFWTILAVVVIGLGAALFFVIKKIRKNKEEDAHAWDSEKNVPEKENFGSGIKETEASE